MDRKFCRTCVYSGFSNVGSTWCGCNYICDTGEIRPRIGEWCLAYKYAPNGRNGRAKALRNHTKEFRRITDSLRGKSDTPVVKPETDLRNNTDDDFRIWLNLMCT